MEADCIHAAEIRKTMYCIQVAGRLDEDWSDWFDGLEIVHCESETCIQGIVQDQAALHAVLRKIRDLGLTLRKVEQVTSPVAPNR